VAENIIQATPFFSVRSVPEAVEFYREKLGFNPQFQMNGYAYLSREGAALRLLVYTPDDGPHAPGTAYIDVHDVDAIVAEHGDRWTELPPKSVYGPVDQAHSQRELFIRDPDGNLLIFGHGIGPNANQWDGRG